MDGRPGMWPMGTYPTYFPAHTSPPSGLGGYQSYQLVPGTEMPHSPKHLPPSMSGSFSPGTGRSRTLPLGYNPQRFYDVPFQDRTLAMQSGDEMQGWQPDLDNEDFPREKGSQRVNSAFETQTLMQNVLTALSGVVAIIVGVLAVYTTMFNYKLLQSWNFSAFSFLASGGSFGFLRFSVGAILVLAIISLLVAFVGCAFLLPTPYLHQTQAVVTAIAAGTGVLLLILVSLILLVSNFEKNGAVRAGNLLCQDLGMWSCGGVAGPHAVEASPAQHQPPNAVPSEATGGAAGHLRHLSASKTVTDFVSSFDDDMTPDFSGITKRCDDLSRLCTPPPAFVESTACVCSGQRVLSTSPHSAEAGPWHGTEGAYCDAWQLGEAPWCFVEPQTLCSGIAAAEHANLTSSAPCLGKVDSRSHTVLSGLSELQQAVMVTCLLGLGVLILGGLLLGRMLSLLPRERFDKWKSGGRGAKRSTQQSGWRVVKNPPPPWDDKGKPLQARFKRAQKEVVKRLKDETPEEVKMLLYAFYQQATYGDVSGPRPFFFYPKTREKWDAWQNIEGMLPGEAIEGYILAAGLIE